MADWESEILGLLRDFKSDLEEIMSRMPKDAHQTDVGVDTNSLLGKVQAMLEWME